MPTRATAARAATLKKNSTSDENTSRNAKASSNNTATKPSTKALKSKVKDAATQSSGKSAVAVTISANGSSLPEGTSDSSKRKRDAAKVISSTEKDVSSAASASKDKSKKVSTFKTINEPASKRLKLGSPKPKGKSKKPPSKDHNAVNGVLVKGGWEELPHNIGRIESAIKTEQLATPESSGEDNDPVTQDMGAPASDVSKSIPKEKKQRASAKKSVVKSETEVFGGIKAEARSTSRNVRGTRANTKDVSTPTNNNSSGSNLTEKDDPPQSKVGNAASSSADIITKVEELVETADKPILNKNGKPKAAPRKKKLPYGLTPGESPFPDYAMPTVEQAYEVNRLLSEIHGKVEAPKEIPAPSLQVSGCGEVPSVLDALIRTLLSASTTGQNAAYAFQGLVERYGLYEDGIGKGSVNWNKVREASLEECEKAIRRGGLSKMKSKNIKGILDMVYQQNLERRAAFLAEKKNGKQSEVIGADKKSQGQKDLEIETANSGVLSLQYMHGLDGEAAMTEFTKFPGIGVKTSSCVILFCLQRPSFAVDTHVYRICQWLKWVPEDKKVTRDQTFSHCEVRIPNELKYSLHQLFIRHGKTCARCRASTGETSEEWENTVCPIDHLVTRTGARKGAPSNNVTPKKAKGTKPGGSASKGSARSKATKSKSKAKKADIWDGDTDAEDTPSDFESDVEGGDEVVSDVESEIDVGADE